MQAMDSDDEHGSSDGDHQAQRRMRKGKVTKIHTILYMRVHEYIYIYMRVHEAKAGLIQLNFLAVLASLHRI